jgi:hypothetical protein
MPGSRLMLTVPSDLEHHGQQAKRRVTDYCFQRVSHNHEHVVPPVSRPHSDVAWKDQRSTRTRAASSMPVVRATSPGAEVREESERRIAQKALRDSHSGKSLQGPVRTAEMVPEEPPDQNSASSNKKAARIIRKFHLCHTQKTNYWNLSSGIQERKRLRRSQLATFVEHPRLSRHPPERREQPSKNVPPSEREFGDSHGTREDGDHRAALTAKPDTLMSEHQSSWNYGSEELARELAAFAAEISNDRCQDREKHNAQQVRKVQSNDLPTDMNETFVYETYIRVPVHDSKSEENEANDTGLLVIDEDDQEVWQNFVLEEDDSDWDEEDPDSNGLVPYKLCTRALH